MKRRGGWRGASEGREGLQESGRKRGREQSQKGGKKQEGEGWRKLQPHARGVN